MGLKSTTLGLVVPEFGPCLRATKADLTLRPQTNPKNWVNPVRSISARLSHTYLINDYQSYDKIIVATKKHSEHNFFSVNAELGSHSSYCGC